jgi:hypothetical protein
MDKVIVLFEGKGAYLMTPDAARVVIGLHLNMKARGETNLQCKVYIDGTCYVPLLVPPYPEMVCQRLADLVLGMVRGKGMDGPILTPMRHWDVGI